MKTKKFPKKKNLQFNILELQNVAMISENKKKFQDTRTRVNVCETFQVTLFLKCFTNSLWVKFWHFFWNFFATN